jgi:hypothetical protein
VVVVCSLPGFAADTEETVLEQQRALDAEKAGNPVRNGVVDELARDVNGDGGLLFVGVDDTTVSTYVINPADNETTPQFTGFQVWGAALIPGASPGDAVVYFVDGSELYRWPSAGVPELCCNLTFAGATSAVVSAAYDPSEGELLFSRNISVEAIYSLPVVAANCPGSCEITQDIVYSSSADIGGLAYDDSTSTLYGTDDSGGQVVSIKSDGSIDPVVAYPGGETDIDGLAFGDGRLFLVTDEPGDIYVYNIAGATFEAPLTNPWTSSEVFCGAAFGEGLIPVELQAFSVE